MAELPTEILFKILIDHFCTPHHESYLDIECDLWHLGVLVASGVCCRWRAIVLAYCRERDMFPVGQTASSKGVTAIAFLFNDRTLCELAIGCAYHGNDHVLDKIIRLPGMLNFCFNKEFQRGVQLGGGTLMLRKIMAMYGIAHRFHNLSIYRALQTAVKCNDVETARWICREHRTRLDIMSTETGDEKLELILNQFVITPEVNGERREYWAYHMLVHLAVKYRARGILNALGPLTQSAAYDSEPMRAMTYYIVGLGDVLFLDHFLGMLDRKLPGYAPNKLMAIMVGICQREECLEHAVNSQSFRMVERVLELFFVSTETRSDVFGKSGPGCPEALGECSLRIMKLFHERCGLNPLYKKKILRSIMKHGGVEKARWVVETFDGIPKGWKGKWKAGWWHGGAEGALLAMADSGSVEMLEFMYHECGARFRVDAKAVCLSNPETMKWVYDEWRRQPDFENSRAIVETQLWSVNVLWNPTDQTQLWSAELHKTLKMNDRWRTLRYVATLESMDCVRMFLEMFSVVLEATVRLPSFAACYNNTKLLRVLDTEYGLVPQAMDYRDPEYPLRQQMSLNTLDWLVEYGGVWLPPWVNESDVRAMDPVTLYWFQMHQDIPGVAEAIRKATPPAV